MIVCYLCGIDGSEFFYLFSMEQGIGLYDVKGYN